MKSIIKKLAVYVPVDHAQKMREALAVAGAGTQGDYTGTSFTSIGHGRFTPNVGAQPAIGKVGKAEQVQEAKVEVILPETIEKQVIDAMQSVHPYEEPAYDLFAIDEPVEKFGLGRIGELPQEIPLETFVEQVKKSFPIRRTENRSASKNKIIHQAYCDLRWKRRKILSASNRSKSRRLYHRRHLLSYGS